MLAVGESPAVVYPASEVDSGVVRADMESASPMRQSLQAAGMLPEELSASVGAGRTLVAMMVDRVDDTPGRISHGQLEGGLCQINGYGCSIHVGLLSFG